MRDLRIWFNKTGEARYISHLDLNRFMLRVIKRAQIPVWYTEGYNPHPYITFALPLSLGFESTCESMDIRITDDSMTDGEVFERFASAVPSGLEIVKVASPKMKQKAIAFADYSVLFFTDPANTDTVWDFVSAPTIKVVKTTKKGGPKEIDLKEFVGYLKVTAQEDGVLLSVRLAAGSVTNINPSLLADALLDRTGIDCSGYSVKRVAMTDSEGRLFN